MITEILKILAPVADCAASYFKIKETSAKYDLTKRIELDCEKMEEELFHIRADGADGDQLRADILRQRILRAQGIALGANLPAAGPAFESGSPLANYVRNLHPDNR